MILKVKPFLRLALLSLAALLGMPSTHAAPQVLLGIDVLEAQDFQALSGMRVGLLTHGAGVDGRGVPTWKVMHEHPAVNLVALYGPEHGIDGKHKAEKYVPNTTHAETGLPVYSLYGPTRKPAPEMLQGIDILVIDLQDVGVRSYTYVSAMRLAMEACFEQGIPVMVLDRPNPLGGEKVDGPPLDKHLMSYVGSFRVPYVHGLTIGELAIMAKKIPGWMEVSEDVQKKGKLYVIPMKGWKRSMLWPDTGLRWTPTSPAIPDFSAAVGYSMTGLGCQLGGFRHGYGEGYPFRLINYSGKSPDQIATTLNSLAIPGLYLQPMPEGRQPGAYAAVTNWDKLRPTEISFQMMRLACDWSGGNPFAEATPAQQRLYKIHVGSEDWWTEISTRGSRARVDKFLDEWEARARQFQQWSRNYWIYK
ncbi:DUF1343 domain-containing protein [Ruficoccus sp. ZRK36]|uniref:DUF1343 domain-containing protein n=1 Tax=Ruficoccus sp. ZRK36 TaxID=2866311 RepID=UPI002106E125|nr:DUF1343 domain-containing protein [Ruficoccus sp. ZRK36]